MPIDVTPECTVRYNDSSGFDCGWHHEPTPHVEGWAHLQERAGADEGDGFTVVSFDILQLVPVCWEILARLDDRLDDD